MSDWDGTVSERRRDDIAPDEDMELPTEERSMPVSFAEVLDYLESQSWEVYRIHPPYRVFCRHGDPNTGFPIVVEVNGGEVDANHVEEIRHIVEGEEEQGETAQRSAYQ